MAKFTLTIQLGNDTMQNGDDIAGALRIAADGVSSIYDGPGDRAKSSVWDTNGNTVGEWSVTA